MSERRGEPTCPLPIVNRGTFDSMRADIANRGDMKRFANDAEDRLREENYDVFAILGHFAGLAGWTEDQTTAAREAMSLTYEVLRRQAEANAMNRSIDS